MQRNWSLKVEDPTLDELKWLCGKLIEDWGRWSTLNTQIAMKQFNALGLKAVGPKGDSTGADLKE